jgi:O-antigen/teichoic acid export membrane protein
MRFNQTATVPTGAELVRDGTVTLICRIGSLFGALALSIATARFLGPAGRGIFSLPTIDAGIATSFFLGLSTSTSYLLLNAKAGRGAIRAALLAAIPFVIGCTALVVALGLIGHHTWATLYAAASLPFAALFAIAQGVCTGTKRIRLANYIGVSLIFVTLTGTLLGFYFIGRTPFVAIAGWLISQAVVATAGIFIIARIAGELDDKHVSTLVALGFAARLGAVNLVTLLNYRADVYIVALFSTPSVLGMYTLAVAGAEAALTATQAVATTTAPHIGSLPDTESRQLTARAARNNVALATVTCLIIAAAAPVLIPAVFGRSFVPVVGALRILLFGIVAMSASAVLSNYFTLSRGRPEVSFYVASASATVSIVLSLILVPRMGINGAAISVASSYVFSAAIMIAYFQHETLLPFHQILILQRADVRAYRQLSGRLIGHLRRRGNAVPGRP